MTARFVLVHLLIRHSGQKPSAVYSTKALDSTCRWVNYLGISRLRRYPVLKNGGGLLLKMGLAGKEKPVI